MTLDATPDNATLLRMAAERQAKRAHPFGTASIRTAADIVPMPAIVWPVRLVLPWSHLVSDNLRHGVINGKLLLTSEYRRCKGQIKALAQRRLGSPAPEPAAYPLVLVAAVWVPDEIRAWDIPNFQKATLDALEGVVYSKDRWVYDSRFYRAGVDVDAPRAEVEIRPLTPCPPTTHDETV